MSTRTASLSSAINRVFSESLIEQSDRQLLDRFEQFGDEAAFACLVDRHGPMILGLCRRLVGSPDLADDVVQAMFLLLARKSRSIRRRESLASWLRRVARSMARQVRLTESARSRRESKAATNQRGQTAAGDAAWDELLRILDEELQQLPERERAPLLLCYLEGRTQEEAAKHLGWSASTLQRRLKAGRELLRSRMTRRGATLGAGLFAGLLAPSACAVMTATMRQSVVCSALSQGQADAVSVLASELVKGAMRMSILAKIGKCAALALVVSSALAGSVWEMGLAGQPEPPPAQKKAVPAAEARQKEPAAEPEIRRDLFGDPLPKGAELRLGTIGFRVPDVAGVGFRPTGELVAITRNLMLHVWPADGTPTAKVTAITASPPYAWRGCALSSNGRFVAAFLDHKLVVWDVSGDKPVEYLSREAHEIHTMFFSPDGEWLAIKDGAIILLCNLAKKTWDELPYPNGLSFSPDGKLIAVTYLGVVSVIDTATRKERPWKEVPKVHPHSGVFSPDGKILAVLADNPARTVRFLSVESGEEIADMKTPPYSSYWLRFSFDGKNILVGDHHRIREWDPSAGKWLREISGPAVGMGSYDQPAVYSADGRRLAAHSGYAVLLWDVEKQRHVRPDLIEGGHIDAITGITVSPDGKLIATDAIDGDIRMWTADTGKPLFRVESTWDNYQRLVFLADSKSFIAVADDNVTPVLRDATTGREIRRFIVPAETAKSEATHDLRLSADGKMLITTNRPNRLDKNSCTVQWDIAMGREVKRTERVGVNVRDEMMLSTIVSPNGQWSIKWGTLSGTGVKDSISLVNSRESMMMPAAFSQDSRLVAASRSPRTGAPEDRERGSLVVYSIKAKTQVAELPTGKVMRQAFSPDGRELAVVGYKEIAIWDLTSLKTVRRFPIEHGNVFRPRGIAFTPDGRRLITAHDDCTALIWDLTGTGRAPGTAAPRLSADALKQMWDALADNDAAKAYTASWELTDRGEQTVALTRERLKPVKAADKDAVGRLVTKLDVPAFADREAAAKSLREMGDSAIPALRAALKTGLSAEAKDQVERVIAAATERGPSSGLGAQQVRAVAILQRIGSEDARKLLEELSGGLDEARLTREAAEAVQVLRGR